MTPAPTECPVCHAAILAHSPATEEEFEEIEFECRCIIQREEDGKWHRDFDCPQPTLDALALINDAPR